MRAFVQAYKKDVDNELVINWEPGTPNETNE